MKILNLVQGSREWLAHRAAHFNASDAPAMMGCSPYKTRSALLRELHTGVAPEVDVATQKRFDNGHRAEALARPLAEKIIGDDLYPVTGTEGRLSASFDGLTLDERIGFEHKALNADLRECFRLIDTIAPEHREAAAGYELPLYHRVQMEQQLHVSGAERILFMASEWDADGDLVEERHCWYYPDDELRGAILAGWSQLEHDLQNYKPEPVELKPAGRAPETLPALHIEVTGAVTASNLREFKAHALAVFKGINRELRTDEDFADAEKTVKWCSDVEDRLKAAKQHALSQTASIDELFRAIDDISAEARRVRLDLDKLVKARKDAIREEIVAGGAVVLRKHIEALNERLGELLMPAVPADFAGSIKGKKSLSSMRDAVDTELARAKIAANEIADRIQINLQALRERDDLSFLFPDVKQLVLKARDDLAAVIAMRIAEHERKEAERRDAEQRAAEAIKRASEAVPPADPAPVAPAAEPQLVAAVAPQPDLITRTEEPPTLKLGAVCERLGFSVTADFLTGLGIQAHVERSAKLYRESDFPRICSVLVAHIQRVAQQPAKVAA